MASLLQFVFMNALLADCGYLFFVLSDFDLEHFFLAIFFVLVYYISKLKMEYCINHHFQFDITRKGETKSKKNCHN